MANDKIYYNSSALFKVKDKKSEKAPDYRASVQLDVETLDAIIASGGKVSIAGWLRDGAQGQFVSLLVSADSYVKPSEGNTPTQSNNAPQDAKRIGFDDDEDIPF